VKGQLCVDTVAAGKKGSRYLLPDQVPFAGCQFPAPYSAIFLTGTTVMTTDASPTSRPPRRRKLATRLTSLLAAAGIMAATPTSAGYPETYERMERLYGFGWGDGYHACRSSGARPLADLPPRTYSSRYNSPLERLHGCDTGNRAACFYDLFDQQCDAMGGCGGLAGQVVEPFPPSSGATSCDASCDAMIPTRPFASSRIDAAHANGWIDDQAIQGRVFSVPAPATTTVEIPTDGPVPSAPETKSPVPPEIIPAPAAETDPEHAAIRSSSDESTAEPLGLSPADESMPRSTEDLPEVSSSTPSPPNPDLDWLPVQVPSPTQQSTPWPAAPLPESGEDPEAMPLPLSTRTSTSAARTLRLPGPQSKPEWQDRRPSGTWRLSAPMTPSSPDELRTHRLPSVSKKEPSIRRQRVASEHIIRQPL